MNKKYENLWNNDNVAGEETSSIIELLKEQCLYFNEKNTTAKAKVIEMQYYQSAMAILVRGVVSSTALTQGRYESQDVETEEKTDINDLLKDKYYALTLYNDKYKFNIFYISVFAYYPIKIELDYDIAKEINGGNKEMTIADFEELKSVLANILKTNKVRCVVQKLRTIVE